MNMNIVIVLAATNIALSLNDITHLPIGRRPLLEFLSLDCLSEGAVSLEMIWYKHMTDYRSIHI